MNTGTFTATAFTVALIANVGWAETTERPATTGQTAQQSAARTGQQPQATFTDQKSFVRDEVARKEIIKEIYDMAADKSQIDQVKEFAESAREDRQEADEKLSELADKLDIDKDADADTQQVRQVRQIRDRLQEADGAEFDRVFLREALGIKQQELSLYQGAAQRAQDEEVKEFADDARSTIQERLSSGRELYQKVTGTAWTPGQREFTPAAAYEQQPGQASPPERSAADREGKEKEKRGEKPAERRQ